MSIGNGVPFDGTGLRPQSRPELQGVGLIVAEEVGWLRAVEDERGILRQEPQDDDRKLRTEAGRAVPNSRTGAPENDTTACWAKVCGVPPGLVVGCDSGRRRDAGVTKKARRGRCVGDVYGFCGV